MIDDGVVASASELFLAMLLGVRPSRLFGVVPRKGMVSGRRMCMVPRLFVMSGLMMFSRFCVVSGGVAEML